MEIRVPDDMTIRDYLLGRLDPASEIVERLDELMLTNIQFTERLGVIEDEIIEEYLEGTLSPAEKQSVESHFLRPRERQRKLQNARLLTARLASATTAPEGNELLQIKASSNLAASLRTRSNFRLYAEIAAAIFLAASLAYLFQLRRDLGKTLRESKEELAQERKHSASLDEQLRTARELAQPSTVILSLFQSGVRRTSKSLLPELKIGPGTRNVHVEAVLSSSVPGAYDVRLETAGKVVWSLDHSDPFISTNGAILIFEVPASALPAGESRFIVSQKNGNETAYPFVASKQ
jgi:hypothetical protein